jgi:outer membrane protein, adhesin transport system
MLNRPFVPRFARRRRRAPWMAALLCTWLSPALVHANEVTDFWRAQKAATATPATPPPSHTVAAAESQLALSAMHDEQARSSARTTAQSQANLAQTAAENERLLMTAQVQAPAAPATQTPTPPAQPTLNLNVPDPRSFHGRTPAGSLKGPRAGLLAEMLDDGSNQDDPVSEVTEPALKQTLNDAVRKAAERTPQMRQIYAEYLAAEADVDQAKGQRWPQLSVTAQTREQYIGSQQDAQVNPGNAVGVNLTTTVFDWGQTRKTIDSRKALADANSEHYQAQREDLAYQVVNTLLEVARQRNIVELYQRYVDRMQRLAQMLAEIVEVDHGRASELTQAKARLLQAETSRDAAAAKARDAELALRKLIGDDVIATPKGPAWPIAPADLDELLAKAELHPAIRQAAAQARAADLNAEATRAASRPKLSWVVSGNTGRDEVGLKQPWVTMLTVSWPLFSGGSQRAAAAAAQYRADAQWQNAEQQKLDYEYQLRTADEDARTAFKQAAEYDQLTTQTDQIRKGFFEQWYQLGQRSLLDVLSAESDYYNNRINKVSSRFDGYQAVIRERAAAGELVNWLRSDSTGHAP